jgi:hypothetical protein
MENSSLKERMPRLPGPGEKVRWRNPRHAWFLGWEDAYGPGPFEVIGLVNERRPGPLRGILLKTKLGEREINEVWLAAGDEPARGPEEIRGWGGYSLDVLLALEV